MLHIVTGDLQVLAFISLVGLVAFHASKRYLRLRHIPGPSLAALTDWWLFVKTWTGTDMKQLSTELHRKYGPVVRLGPNRVIFSDPGAISIVFGTTHPYEKVRTCSLTPSATWSADFSTSRRILMARSSSLKAAERYHLLLQSATNIWLAP